MLIQSHHPTPREPSFSILYIYIHNVRSRGFRRLHHLILLFACGAVTLQAGVADGIACPAMIMS